MVRPDPRPPESYAVPVETDGGDALRSTLVERYLFDTELAIRAAAARDELFCWPPLDGETARPRP